MVLVRPPTRFARRSNCIRGSDDASHGGDLLDQLNCALTAAIEAALAIVESDDWTCRSSHYFGILEGGDLGLHLTTPWQVVIAGPPNAGKSSLINALAG